MPVSRLSESVSGRVRCVRTVEFVRKMRGASQPHLLKGEDGGYYVVKFRNNPQHSRVLANEMFAARLAQLVGLPVPKPAFVEVPAGLIAGNPQLEFEIGPRREPCSPGVQFGSRFPGIPGETLVVDFLPDRLLHKAVKSLTVTFLGAFVFDKWTCNCDGRQVIFTRPAASPSAYSAWLIDHGFCFNDGEWNFPDSPIRSIYPRRLVYESVRGLTSFEPVLSRIENLEAGQVEECLQGIPAEWCGEDPLQSAQLSRLADQLHARRKGLRQALIDAKNSSLRPFPNWA